MWDIWVLSIYTNLQSFRRHAKKKHEWFFEYICPILTKLINLVMI